MMLEVAIVLLVVAIFLQRRKRVEDFSKLTASIAKLQADVAILLARKSQSNQTAIDALQAQVDTLDASVVAATPPAPAA